MVVIFVVVTIFCVIGFNVVIFNVDGFMVVFKVVGTTVVIGVFVVSSPVIFVRQKC